MELPTRGIPMPPVPAKGRGDGVWSAYYVALAAFYRAVGHESDKGEPTPNEQKEVPCSRKRRRGRKLSKRDAAPHAPKGKDQDRVDSAAAKSADLGPSQSGHQAPKRTARKSGAQRRKARAKRLADGANSERVAEPSPDPCPSGRGADCEGCDLENDICVVWSGCKCVPAHWVGVHDPCAGFAEHRKRVEVQLEIDEEERCPETSRRCRSLNDCRKHSSCAINPVHEW